MNLPVNFDDLRLDLEADPARYTKQNSVYSLTIASIAPAATAQPNFTVDAASMFVWTKTTFSVDLAAAALTESTRVLPCLKVQLTDTGSDRTLYDVAQRLDNIAGTGEIPFILPTPYLFKPNAVMNSLFTNYSAAQTYTNVLISFIGYRVYDLQPNAPRPSQSQPVSGYY
jgi:hypothetical protein